MTVPERHTAVVACTTTWQEFPTLWKRLLDQVWAFLAGTDLRTDGHNIMMYRDSGASLQVEVGVQVVRAFESRGPVVASMLPAGRAAMAVHRGPYAGLEQAHRAVLSIAPTRAYRLLVRGGRSTATGIPIPRIWKPRFTGSSPPADVSARP
ncbi:MAG TPA: GyrI-like domain-containing protein [Candidatus Dormibacteraeota bacterium]|nr:GyrI-like domain-containing protein [Candidatus Dormibacteraeota bacterium]